MTLRDKVVEEARSWLNTRWVHQGRTRQGIDCAGLIVVVGRKFDILDYDDKTNYQRRTAGLSFLKPFRESMRRKSFNERKPGDVVLFRDAHFPCHSTIYTANEGIETIVHATILERKVVEERLQRGDWLQRVVACFEYKGIDN